MCVHEINLPQHVRLSSLSLSKWGCDLTGEHEQYLLSHCGQKPLFVTDFPAAIKPFYAKCSEEGTGDRQVVSLPGGGVWGRLDLCPVEAALGIFFPGGEGNLHWKNGISRVNFEGNLSGRVHLGQLTIHGNVQAQSYLNSWGGVFVL